MIIIFHIAFILICSVIIWVGLMYLTGDKEKQGAAGFAAFMLISVIIVWSGFFATLILILKFFLNMLT